ncbi:MAG: molybdopterin oxidoreductase family protein, partial [Mameliella sp.]|nr:molybdopterin oxidoreductase family protein [Mameliella sp.]
NDNYVIPHIIYSDAYSSEMVAYADLILPDTTYLERHDCISLLDRPICEADAAADAIRWPVVEPDRNVKGFQSALCDLGAKLGLPGFVNEDGSQKYADYADYITNHERRPGIGPLAGWRMGANGLQHGRGGPNEGQLDSYIRNGGFFAEHIPDGANYYKPWNRAYQDWAVKLGLYDSPQPYLFSLYVEPMRKFQLAAEGHGDRQPPEHLRERIKATMSPLPIWYETDQQGNEGFTINALTQRPMAMYHSWGSQNAWLRQLHGHNPLYLPTKLMRQHDLSDGDWARVSSPHGEITVPVMEMAALNENTVWTWNAIGKRKGAWALDKDAPEATRAFLLNHLIHELLPPKADGMRWANSDPITGQAAWFDLKVRIEKTEAPREARPEYPVIKSPVPNAPDNLAWKVGK